MALTCTTDQLPGGAVTPSTGSPGRDWPLRLGAHLPQRAACAAAAQCGRGPCRQRAAQRMRCTCCQAQHALPHRWCRGVGDALPSAWWCLAAACVMPHGCDDTHNTALYSTVHHLCMRMHGTLYPCVKHCMCVMHAYACISSQRAESHCLFVPLCLISLLTPSSLSVN